MAASRMFGSNQAISITSEALESGENLWNSRLEKKKNEASFQILLTARTIEDCQRDLLMYKRKYACHLSRKALSNKIGWPSTRARKLVVENCHRTLVVELRLDYVS